MTSSNFIDDSTIKVEAKDGEVFTLKTHFPVPKTKQKTIVNLLVSSFEKNFSDDKSSMVYFVLCDMMINAGFSFYSQGGDRSLERQRIGSKIRQLREAKGIEAKQLAVLANIDAANLSRIEQGKYSVGLDILSKIANTLGVKVDLV